MVSFNAIWKLCVIVAFGLSATVTATDVAQEQPKKKSLVSRFFGKKDASANKLQEVPESNKTDTEEKTDTDEPPMFSVEWYLLPKPINRGSLRDRLPWHLQNAVPRDCNKPILPVVERQIRDHFSWVDKKKGPSMDSFGHTL